MVLLDEPTGDLDSATGEEITALLAIATEKDEVVVLVESGGGTVPGYGLAASQLKRITDKGVPLTVAVDKVAASGGYMMACVASRILAAPFAVIGSIGVITARPMVEEMLGKIGVEMLVAKAGDHKDAGSFFHRFAQLNDGDAQKTARHIWRSINLVLAKPAPRTISRWISQ